MISARRRWAAGALLVALGAAASPQLVPVYDGLSTPDEPYRYVDAPPGAPKTAAPTDATASTPVKAGISANGFSVATGETGPQFSLFVPAGGLKDGGGTAITIRVTPKAPVDAPPTTKVDGNVYVIALEDSKGPVTLTAAAAIATLYLRATSQKTPQPNMYYRATATAPWMALPTNAGGFDVRVSSFKGAGEYVVAHAPQVAKKKSAGGLPVLPLVLVGILVLLLGVVFVVRLRSDAE